MTETIRYGLLGREDIKVGTGTFEVTLADGRVITMSALDVGTILNDSTLYTAITGLSLTSPSLITPTGSLGDLVPLSSTLAGLPAAGTAGRKRRLTDDNRDLRYDTGNIWSAKGRIFYAEDFDIHPDRTAAQNDTGFADLNTALPTNGALVVLPPGIIQTAAEIALTKPAVIQGAGRGATEILLTSNASGRDGIHSTQSLVVRDLKISTQTAPTTDLAMAGIRIDPQAAGGVRLLVDNVEVQDFNFGVFADGRDTGGQDFDMDTAIVHNAIIRVSSAAGATAPGVFFAGSRLAIVESCNINNQDLGDHNVYFIRNHHGVVRDCWLRNTAATASLAAVKMVTELAGDSGTLGIWSIENNTMESNSLPIFTNLTGSIRLPKLRIAGNTIRTARSTTAGDSAAINMTASNTAVYDHITIDDVELSDLQLGGIVFTAATGATFRDMFLSKVRIFDFSKSAASTYNGVTTGSLGTYQNMIINSLHVDGNSTGRSAFELSVPTRVIIQDVLEQNVSTTSTWNNVVHGHY